MSDAAVSFGEAGPRTNDVDSAAVTAAMKSAGEARPPGTTKHGAPKEPNSQCRNARKQLHNTSSEFAVSRLLEELRERFVPEFGCSAEF